MTIDDVMLLRPVPGDIIVVSTDDDPGPEGMEHFRQAMIAAGCPGGVSIILINKGWSVATLTQEQRTQIKQEIEHADGERGRKLC